MPNFFPIFEFTLCKHFVCSFIANFQGWAMTTATTGARLRNTELGPPQWGVIIGVEFYFFINYWTTTNVLLLVVALVFCHMFWWWRNYQIFKKCNGYLLAISGLRIDLATTFFKGYFRFTLSPCRLPPSHICTVYTRWLWVFSTCALLIRQGDVT